MHSRDVLKQLWKDGWYEVNQVGSYKQFKHPTKSGRVTVPHPNRDIPTGTLKSIEKQPGIKLRQIEPRRCPGGKERSHGIHRVSS
jgi:predicted RNA binding protein YcfA (HicA-like mRNA interferase family)